MAQGAGRTLRTASSWRTAREDKQMYQQGLRQCKRARYGWKKGEAAKEEFGNPALARRDGVRKIQAQAET